ncbi:MAG: hypothetical protein ACR2JY_00565 [Chloroflexota bacterium]
MVRIDRTDLHILNMRARMPFRYGIATLLALPHLLVRVELELDGRRQVGIAADGLAPKWFTKDPNTTFAEDVDDMLRVSEAACAFARNATRAASIFDLWQQVYRAQDGWAAAQGFPPLLAGFGVSLVERAMLDAFCRLTAMPFAVALRTNTLGIRLGELHGALANAVPAQFLPPAARRTVRVRHTVGLSDPLTDAEIPPEDRLADGLPQSLETAIQTYGLTHFKIKLWGNADRDLPRLQQIAAVLAANNPDYAFTLDGNEQYHDVGAFRQFWQTLESAPALTTFLPRLLFVEQPLHRDVALDPAIGAALVAWHDRPSIIIDESDSGLGSVPAALERGYAGASHKNCKGIVKGIANACLLEQRRRDDPAGRYLLSGEDLANVGPVALLQDLALMANLGIAHVERNGHHYFTGLSMYPDDVQERVLTAHPDLYRRHERGYATLRIRKGTVQTGSVVDAPFGLGFDLDPGRFTPREQWDVRSLEAE